MKTAALHFLGYYPKVKYERLGNSLPADMSDLGVLDIGSNAGLYPIEIKQRNGALLPSIDVNEHYLRQARLCAEVTGLDISFECLSMWDVGVLQELFDRVIFLGLLPPATSATRTMRRTGGCQSSVR